MKRSCICVAWSLRWSFVAQRTRHESRKQRVSDCDQAASLVNKGLPWRSDVRWPVVAAEAQVRIDHGDLTALLYLQGYSEDEFVR